MALNDDLTLQLLDSAWQRVAANAGGPGVDSVTIDSFSINLREQLTNLRERSLNGTYRCRPMRRILIQKHPGSNETRKLLVPCVRDRVLQTAIARALSKSFEEEFLEASFAYRPDRGVDRAVARILQLRDRGYTTLLDADVTSYFDNVNHHLLMRQLAAHVDPEDKETLLLGLLNQWVRPAEWDGHQVHPVQRGIPQGSPISPLFANIFLSPLDKLLATGDHKLIRYSDDFLILCKNRAEADSAMQLTIRGLDMLGLELKPEKTRITTFEEGFKFLGVQFRGAEAMIPWKAKDHQHGGHVVSVAHMMSGRQLRPYLDVEKSAASSEAAPLESSGPSPHSGPRPPTQKPRESSLENDTAKDTEDMPNLYLTHTGAVLRKSGDRFLVDHDGGIIADIPYHRLEHILVFGNIQLTSQAMAEALDHNICISLFTRHKIENAIGPAAIQVLSRRGKLPRGDCLQCPKRSAWTLLAVPGPSPAS